MILAHIFSLLNTQFDKTKALHSGKTHCVSMNKQNGNTS